MAPFVQKLLSLSTFINDGLRMYMWRVYIYAGAAYINAEVAFINVEAAFINAEVAYINAEAAFIDVFAGVIFTAFININVELHYKCWRLRLYR